MDAKKKPRPTPNEVWVQRPDIPKVVMEMLESTAQEYGLVLWINGKKIYPSED